MEDPLGLKLLRKFFVMSFQITCYVFVFFIQIVWYLCRGKVDKIADAWGGFGRAVTDAIADMLK